MYWRTRVCAERSDTRSAEADTGRSQGEGSAVVPARLLSDIVRKLEPGTVILVTHRRETDVPLICPPLYFGATMRTNLRGRMSFAARDDMFLPGFFAGVPPDLPLAARRLLYRVGVARWLPVVQVYPIRSARVASAWRTLSGLTGTRDHTKTDRQSVTDYCSVNRRTVG